MNYLNPPDSYQSPNSAFTIIPCAYEGRTTYGDGASDGPEAIIEASHHLEYYDVITETEPFTYGVRTLEPVTSHEEITEVARTIDHNTTLPVYIGGDHSITLAVNDALADTADMMIFDAHADMRYKWNGSETNHACVTRHVAASRNTAVLGVRSMDRSEQQAAANTDSVDLVAPNNVEDYHDTLSDDIHISIDVDVLDPSIISHTGTPEPNGISYEVLRGALQRIISKHNVVSVDIVEFAPANEPARRRAEAYTIAKLIYHILGLTTTQREVTSING